MNIIKKLFINLFVQLQFRKLQKCKKKKFSAHQPQTPWPS